VQRQYNGSAGEVLVRRVVPAFEDASRPPDEREQLWLVVEWRDDELQPAAYFLPSIVKTSHKKLISDPGCQRRRDSEGSRLWFLS